LDSLPLLENILERCPRLTHVQLLRQNDFTEVGTPPKKPSDILTRLPALAEGVWERRINPSISATAEKPWATSLKQGKKSHNDGKRNGLSFHHKVFHPNMLYIHGRLALQAVGCRFDPGRLHLQTF